MSDTAPPLDTATQAWLDALAQEPVAALDRLLMGGVWLGAYAALEPAQALPQFLPTALEDTLDTALQGWLSQQLRQNALPTEATPKQYALALTQAGVLLQTLSLPRSVAWCRERAPTLWAWLNRQPSFASRDPRSALLRALALHQTNRDLLPFWMGLCRQGTRWAALALFGLRRLPINDDGRMPEGLPTALVGGLLDYGLSLHRHAGDEPQKQTEHKRKWLAELDFLSAVYPMSSQRWSAKLRESLVARPVELIRPVRNWLDERLPSATQISAANERTGRLSPGFWEEDIQPHLAVFDLKRDQVMPALRTAADRRLNYAQETGDAYFLVRTYCRLADFLLKSPDHQASTARDAAWALQLGQQAVNWAPGNHLAWSAVARALDELGDWPGAQTVFWYARRRFPYNPQAHNQLGHALAMRGQVAEGEAVYRAAIRRFPDDPVCWADLGNTLRIAQGPEAALAVYRQAKQRFHDDSPICSALTGVLIDLGQVAQAQDALAWARQVADPHDKKDQNVLDNLQRRFQQLASGQRPAPKRQPTRPQGAIQPLAPLEQAAGTGLQGLADLGCATLWRQARELDKARQALSQNAPAQDVRWQAEEAWLIAQEQGWPAARAWLEQRAAQHPGDGVLAAMRLYATEQSGDTVEWRNLRGRFEELAPLIRVRQDRQAHLPDELSAALKAVENASGEPQLDELDDDFRMALSVYQTAQDDTLAPLVQQDYLAARQLSLY